ncbi:SgcJ/EcaC family oxidoreductase [Methylobacterium sp. NEAU 140]|uniref:YybH family protein n=1 Tax=Methylobacterium sp. NEAU 140 TaxID=3064945 RepID=UPI00273440FC|nr:SgcJ/EcaC family oxidoreductase [Methylobacterium sp. NEAU 140]MDP4027177.1 SgcJ/EcaC family oxidoreductase [Methylobacterium sp. NEAU 140]
MNMRDEIQMRNEAFRLATAAGDALALAALYTEDAWFLPQGSAEIQGRRAIERLWQERLKRIAEVKLSTIDVALLGNDHAREVGHFIVRTKAGGPDVMGKYLVVWQRIAGEWYLAADAVNSSA